MRVGQCIKLVDELCPGDWIGLCESPAAFQHERVDHTYRHHFLKPFEGVKNHGAMAPWARQRYIEMITHCFG
jgi:hypothetical protein